MVTPIITGFIDSVVVDIKVLIGNNIVLIIIIYHKV